MKIFSRARHEVVTVELRQQILFSKNYKTFRNGILIANFQATPNPDLHSHGHVIYFQSSVNNKIWLNLISNLGSDHSLRNWTLSASIQKIVTD